MKNNILTGSLYTAGILLPQITFAEIQNDKVVVWSDEVQNPQSVRFAWNERAMPNLFNKEGLPAVPFSTNGK